MKTLLGVLGILLNTGGGLAMARGLFISKKDALRLGVTRWAGETEEENLKLPAVQDRLTQRWWGSVGALLVVAGAALQLWALA
jgi:hypothetical protein